jgi:D-aminopeptidase
MFPAPGSTPRSLADPCLADARRFAHREQAAMKSHEHTHAEDLGIHLQGTRGEWDAISDVPGVEVGYATLIAGASVRTGVTAILPRGKRSKDPVFAGWFPLNGNGEMTGTTWIEEAGFLEGPIMLTNTHSVGVVRDAVVGWQHRTGSMFQPYSYPVVAETYDGWLNDINGFHIRPEHAVAAIESAAPGPLAQGNVGGGAGMVCFQFKGGTGTASRRADDYTIGVLVQANFGLRHQLQVTGVPVGKEIPLVEPWGTPTASVPGASAPTGPATEQGSIIVVVATDAPLLPHQLKRLARRAALGLARTGGCAGNSSGDIMIAFSTANAGAASADLATVSVLANARMTALFDATIFATEEAILNAMLSAETMSGHDGHTVQALAHEQLRRVLQRWPCR